MIVRRITIDSLDNQQCAPSSSSSSASSSPSQGPRHSRSDSTDPGENGRPSGTVYTILGARNIRQVALSVHPGIPGHAQWTDASQTTETKTSKEFLRNTDTAETVPKSDKCDADATTASVREASGDYEDDISRGTMDSEEEAAADVKVFCWGLCCLQGCIWGIIAMFYFFVLLPAGFLLIVFGTTRDLPWAIGCGSAILIVAICLLPGVIIFVRYKRLQSRDRRKEYRVERHKAVVRESYDNPIVRVT